MHPQNPIPIKPAQLRAAFKTDLAACWNLALRLHPDHKPYAFALWGLEGCAHFMPCVLTEEGLTQVAGRYVKKGICDTLEEARDLLRYSVAAAPQLERMKDKLTSVNALLNPHEKWLCEEETAGYELLAQTAMDAFKALDAEGLFGTGKAREQLLLIIITEDTEKNWAKPSAKLLNPPVVFERFEADTKIEGVFMCSSAIALSPDERSLYSTGSRKFNREGPDDTSEVVAYDIVDFQLKRRWDFLFPTIGDSGRAISCSCDGKTILVMRARYTDKPCQTLLMRFGRDKNKIIQQAQITGEPAGFAVSSDDSRVAVPMNDGLKQSLLHVLDGKLSVLAVLQLPARARHLKFLGSGDLLAATDAGIFRVDPNFKITDTPFKDKCLRLSVDDKESLAVAILNFLDARKKTEDETEIGCRLLHLPSFETALEFTPPDLIVQMAAISPDGRSIAFHAQKIKTYKYFIVVCEADTGREIARQQAGFTNALKFLRDNRTLAIARSATTTTEPIVFWPVPGL